MVLYIGRGGTAMGAHRVRRLLLAAAAGALLASGAAASQYTYEKSWEYDVFARERLYVKSLPRVGGDVSGLAVPAGFFNESYDWFELYYLKFDVDGNRIERVLLYEMSGMPLVDVYIEDCILDSGVGILTYNLAESSPFNDYYYSVIQKPGFWYGREEGWYRIKDLAAFPGASYYYCYRIYAGGYRVCKMVGEHIVSYFTPLSGVTDMEAGPEGAVYIASDDLVSRYVDTGSLLRSWRAPKPIIDLTLDVQNRLLALASDNFTYVYDDAGSLLGSFTAPYTTRIYSADIGPDDKYFVLGCDHYDDEEIIHMYRFAPSPTNIVPTSLGKIKAVFN
jgi:hypothetical protein